MKKNLLYVVIGLFLLATTSCTDESIVDVREGLKVTGGVGSESRTTFVHDEEWTRTHWVAEDAIGLYTDAQSNVAYKATSGGSSNTEFIPSGTETIAPEEGQKVTAYYPYNSDATEDEVKQSVYRTMDMLAPGGGYVFSGGFLGSLGDETSKLKNKWVFEAANEYSKTFYKK